MNRLSESINQLMLALIVGVATIAVSYVSDISRNLQIMATSVEQLNLKMSQVYDTVRDHETRLRSMEGKGRE